jgi:hypothetical protein
MGPVITTGLVPAPVVPPRPGRFLHVRADERRAELLRAFAALQTERDDHEAVCAARTLDNNPCLALWSLDERLRLAWAEILFLDGGLVDLYEPRPCAPECPDCAAAADAEPARPRPGHPRRELAAVSGPHHAARCTAWDDGPCICEAPATAVAA